VRRDMTVHTNDALLHFTGMATWLLELTTKASTLEEKVKCSSCRRSASSPCPVTWVMEMTNFNAEYDDVYESEQSDLYFSKDVQTFDHALSLELRTTHNALYWGEPVPAQQVKSCLSTRVDFYCGSMRLRARISARDDLSACKIGPFPYQPR
jgi:hypothetical protein